MNSTSTSMRLKHFQTYINKATFPKLLLLLFITSFIIHLSIVTIFINQPIALDDMFQYDMLARSLKEGNGFRWYSKADVEILRPYYSQFLDIDHLSFPDQGLQTSFRAPGYPFFLALLYFFVPESFRFVLARLVQAGLAAALAPLVAILGYQLDFSKRVCILAGVGMIFYPILLFYPIGLASENLYIVLGLLSIISIIYSIRKNSWVWILLAGLICGITMFTRSIFAVFTLFSGIWISRYSPLRKKAGLVFLLVAFGVCLPWSVRNSVIMKKPAFVENSLGYNLFIGYHPEGDGGFVSQIAIIPMNILDDGERDRLCMQQAIEFIRNDPFEAGRRVFARLIKLIGPEDREFFYFYSNDVIGAISQPWLALIYSLLVIPWGSLLILGVAGLWQTRNNKMIALIIIFLTCYGLPHLFIIAEPRFHLAFVPVLMPFATFTLHSKNRFRWDQLFRRENTIFGIFLLLLICVFILGFTSNFSKLILIMSEGGNKLFFSY
ncbi:MAG TPA: hypothetical protein DCK95_06585 [Anaerolineaceae bacterium]|nr:hypothetical protein [Anaerolineaceae bacterium]